MSESQSWSRFRLLLPRGLRTGALIATTLTSLPVFAQTEAPPPPPAEAAPAAEPAPPPPPVTTPTPAQLAAVTAAQAEPAPAGVSAEPAVAASTPAPADESAKPLDVAVWGRLGNNISAPEGGDADAFADAEVDLLLSGRIHKYVGWQADFVATYGPGVDGAKSTASILDLIGKFELHDAFNVWFGRMLVPSDRSNFSGAWFMSPWMYPGLFVPGEAPVGPRQGAFGRNDGATVWGQFGGGLLKYYASVFDLTVPQTSPLYSGRLNLALINPEPGYYHSSTYYGGKDILAIGLSAQYKKDGSTGVDPATMLALTPDDYTGFSADVLFEKNLGVGTIDLEGAFYSFTGDNENFDWSYYALASYLLPTEIGIGKLQPLVRFQQAKPSAEGADNANIITAQVGYAIKEYAARLALGWERLDNGPTKADTFFLGIQLQK